MPNSRPIVGTILPLLWAFWLTACWQRSDSPSETAYAGAAQLRVFQALDPSSPVLAELEFGHRVVVLRRHRYFAYVRTEGGVEGWVEATRLLDPQQMAAFHRFSRQVAQLSSQGKATTWGPANVHTAPCRNAPTVYRLREGLLVDVVGSQVVPRTACSSPPGLLTSWSSLNSYTPPDAGSIETPADEWRLVRLPSGLAGWVLSSFLTMALPEEVARWAEGQRVTAYFTLGRIIDRGQTHHAWLWATLSGKLKPYQFDRIQVWSWNPRRQRYEPLYRESNLRGYYPITVSLSEPAVRAWFSIVLYAGNGQFVQRRYQVEGRQVQKVDEAPWKPPTEPLPDLEARREATPLPWWRRWLGGNR